MWCERKPSGGQPPEPFGVKRFRDRLFGARTSDLLREVRAERAFGSGKPGESGISHFQSGNRQEHPQTSGEAEGSILKEVLKVPRRL
jgi:hypothetical protein